MSKNESLVTKSKLVFKNYLIQKYPVLHSTDSDLISNIETIKLTNGRSNEIFFCQLIPGLHQNDHLIDRIDLKVVVRFFGSDLTGSGNSYKMDDLKEKLIYEKVSKTLKLPKILQSFPEGRIEEFFELQNLDLDEFENLSSEIARIISKVHSLNMDEIVEKDPNRLKNVLNELYKNYLENKSNLDDVEFENTELKDDFQRLAKFNYKKIVDWAIKVNEKINCKMLFSHNDINRTNFHWILDSNQNKELILIDFEYANFSYRFDLSNYLVELTIGKAIGQQEIVDSFFPNEEFCTKFFVNYLYNMRKNRDYQFNESTDNLDKLKVEVDFGCIIINLIRLLWILSHNKFDELKFDFLENACLRFNLMKNLHEKFCMKYRNLI